jgi:hypothetical protein
MHVSAASRWTPAEWRSASQLGGSVKKGMPGNLLFGLAYDNKVVTYLEEMESERVSPEEGWVLCQQ